MADSNQIPADKINLRLIIPAYGESGKAKDFIFSPNDSAADIAQYVFDHWPEDWADQEVPKAEILRLIYQGRFLHGNVTLGNLFLPLGKTTVMHLVPRENLPKVNSQDNCPKSKTRSSGCCHCLGRVQSFPESHFRFRFREGGNPDALPLPTKTTITNTNSSSEC